MPREKWNENITLQNLWNVAKTVLRGKFIVIQAFFKKQEKSQINNLTYHLNELEKEEQAQSQQKKRNNKDQKGNKWNRDLKKNRKDQ